MFSFAEFSGFFIHGDVRGAIAYLKDYPEMKDVLETYWDLYEEEHYLSYGLPEKLEQVLLAYQKYFRNVFYIRMEEDKAVDTLFQSLSTCLHVEATEEVLEEAQKRLFEVNGWHYLGGKTNGHYGPYVWKTTKEETYEVELPDGICSYRVNILDDFIFRSWMDYITFHRAGTGGWTDLDGTINCVASVYDFQSEKFRVSLLKHEAQHAMDMKRWPSIVPSELEYRAKLVELIYSKDETLLEKLLSVADENRPDDSHAVASVRLKRELASYQSAPIGEIQKKALELLQLHTIEMDGKYQH